MTLQEALDRQRDLVDLIADAALSEYQAFISEKESYKVTDSAARARAKILSNNMRERYQLEFEYIGNVIASLIATSGSVQGRTEQGEDQELS